MKRISIIFTSLLISYSLTAQYKVVIDAGHGGKDPGAVGQHLKEKNINLDVALELGKMIESGHSDVKVIYTRKTDVFVELQQRANIANRAKANLFISIHTNASTNRSAYGTETYTLGLRRSNDNFEVAKRENEVILLEADYKQTYEGFDPRSAESYIMFDVMQNKYMVASINMASFIQDEFVQRAGRRNNGVRQDVFLVLRNTSMPSVLVELGYVSNPNEERFLSSGENKRKLAAAIYNGFRKFKNDWDQRERRTNVVAPSSQRENEKEKDSNSTSKDTVEQSIPSSKEQSKPSSSKSEATNKKNEVAASNVSVAVSKTTEGAFYTIQYITSPTPLDPKSKLLKSVSPSGVYQQNKVYKYYHGEYKTKESARKNLPKIQKIFHDAFVIKIKNGQRMAE